MATPTVPFKTQLGQDELRQRTHGLGQRHRTLLFLIDGRRPLSAVLSLAQQAGAATQHFEDLLRLGLVELPPDPTPPVELPPLLVDVADATELTTVELVVQPEADEEVTVRGPLTTMEPIEPALLHLEGEMVDDSGDAVGDALQAERVSAPPPVPPPEPPRPRAAPFERPASPPAPALKPAVRQRPAVVPVLDKAVGAPTFAPRQAAEASLDIDLPLPDQAEAQFLQRVRDLLTDTLRIDAPLFSARTFMRVRNAQSAGELIDLVWEIQDHLSHKRDSRRELQTLQRARELLGLGNTLVAEETRPPYLDE